MTYTDRQVANLTAALIKAEAYIASGRVYPASETIISALDAHRAGLATMDQITAFDNSMATLRAVINHEPPAATKATPSNPETAA